MPLPNYGWIVNLDLPDETQLEILNQLQGNMTCQRDYTYNPLLQPKTSSQKLSKDLKQAQDFLEQVRRKADVPPHAEKLARWTQKSEDNLEPWQSWFSHYRGSVPTAIMSPDIKLAKQMVEEFGPEEVWGGKFYLGNTNK